MKGILPEEVLETVNNCIRAMEPENSIDEISLAQINDDFTVLGIDSILFIYIIVSLEEAFKCEIPASKLLITEMNTIQKIIDELQKII